MKENKEGGEIKTHTHTDAQSSQVLCLSQRPCRYGKVALLLNRRYCTLKKGKEKAQRGDRKKRLEEKREGKE